MTVKTGGAWAGIFETLAATGAFATPSVGPAGVLYVDGVADAATVTITGSNPYKFAVTLPSLTAGQRVDMYITATIDGIATGNPVASEQADTALVSEVKTETAAILEDTAAIGTSVLAATVEGTYTVQQVLRIMVGALAGKVTGGGTTTITFRDLSDTLNLIAATVDSSGNRSGVTITLA
jgi:hypothetical protein